MKKLFSLSIKAMLTLALMFSAAPAVFAGGPVTSASAYTTVNPYPRTIHVSSTGKVTVEADTAVIALTVETRGKTAKEAQTSNREDVKKLTDILVSQGVAKGDIKNSYYTLYPEYNYDVPVAPTSGVYPIKAYIASNNLNVETKNLDKVSDILDEAVSLESVRIGGTSYKIVNKTAAEEKAREMAIRSAKAKAAKLADMFQVVLGKITSINEYSYDNGYAYYDTAQQNIDVTMQIDLGYEIKD